MTRISVRHPFARIAGGLGVVLLGSLRCSGPLDVQPLQRFETCEDLQLFLEDQILHPAVEQSFGMGGPVVGCSPYDPLSAGGVAADEATGFRASEGEGENRTFTTTNTQELDVDEPDFVKNNGDHIFVLRRGEMIILSAWPAEEMHVLSRTPISGVPFTMIFDDNEDPEPDRALVVSRFFSDKPQVLVRLFDLSDITEPRELRTIAIDGDFVDARGVGSEVMFVTRSQLSLNVELDFTPFSDDENRRRLREAGIGRILPQISDFVVGVDEAPRVDKAIACENTYAPSRTDGRSIMLVHGLDLSDPTGPLLSTGVVAGFSHVYASTAALYLADTQTSDGGYFTPDFATTRIHKLDAFTGSGAAADYKASGAFAGQIKDELSLDEGPDGSLRMVITDDTQSQDVTLQTTSLLVLQEDSTALREVARVDDIGRGEQVESVRFLGDFAYVVTYPVDAGFFIDETGLPRIPFTDPLFVIDLKDPKAPVLRGELEVDGYSAYIHPLDEGHLLTVGVNTDAATGDLLGLSLIIFDVVDPDRPSVLHRLNFGDGGTGSEALFDRHAFTLLVDPVSERRTLGIPVQSFSPSAGLLESSGLAVFDIDLDAGITQLGMIEQGNTLYGGGPAVEEEIGRFNGPCAAVRRSLMIADDTETIVYAVSTAGVSAASVGAVDDEEPITTVSTVALGQPADALCDFSGSPL